MPISWEDINLPTVNDPELQSMITAENVDLFNGVLLYNGRIVIPASLQRSILNTLHPSHQGVTSMILRAKASVYWPNIARDIKRKRQNCRVCDIYATSQLDMPPIQPETPTYLYQHICSDYFRPPTIKIMKSR